MNFGILFRKFPLHITEKSIARVQLPCRSSQYVLLVLFSCFVLILVDFFYQCIENVHTVGARVSFSRTANGAFNNMKATHACLYTWKYFRSPWISWCIRFFLLLLLLVNSLAPTHIRSYMHDLVESTARPRAPISTEIFEFNHFSNSHASDWNSGRDFQSEWTRTSEWVRETERAHTTANQKANGGHRLYFCHHFLSILLFFLFLLSCSRVIRACSIQCSIEANYIQNVVYRMLTFSLFGSFGRLSFWRSFTIALLYALLSGAVALTVYFLLRRFYSIKIHNTREAISFVFFSLPQRFCCCCISAVIIIVIIYISLAGF